MREKSITIKIVYNNVSNIINIHKLKMCHQDLVVIERDVFRNIISFLYEKSKLPNY